MRSLGLREDGSSKHKNLLFGSNNTTFNHNEIVIDFSVMRESSHRGDDFIGQISISGSIVVASSSNSFTDSIDFFVLFGSVVITEMTSSGNSPSNTRRVPRSDTSNFSVPSVRFLLQVFNTESFDDSLEPFTLGDSQDIQHFVRLEDRVHSHFFFEKTEGPVNFFSNRVSSVHLDLHDVVFLLS